MFQQIVDIGTRFKDNDLVTSARHGMGRARIRSGAQAQGFALLDEVMAGVTSGGVSPMMTGVIYCSVLDACREASDLGRAAEWASAMHAWCETQADDVPYRGRCMVFRTEVMRFRGDWPEALEEANRACARLAGPPPHQAASEAFYQQAEIYRVRGELAEAEKAYVRASELGRSPQPGLALLRLAQGNVDAAQAAIRQVVLETQLPATRCAVLAAYVEIMIAADDIPAAREGAEEVSRIAAQVGTPFLDALSAHARGSVLLAGGEAQSAVGELRRAAQAWQTVDAPYELARTRMLVGLASVELGDQDTAALEMEAARHAFKHLGAAGDLAGLEELSHPRTAQAAAGLTGREIEVLALVSTGKSNRDIATDLFISEKTVARHVSNIFNKLGVSSRAAATAYAYQHDLT